MKREHKYFGRKELLRYSLIVPLINGTNPYATIEEYCKEVSEKVYEYEGKMLKIKPRTIKGWYSIFFYCSFKYCVHIYSCIIIKKSMSNNKS